MLRPRQRVMRKPACAASGGSTGVNLPARAARPRQRPRCAEGPAPAASAMGAGPVLGLLRPLSAPQLPDQCWWPWPS
ncbi:hypothetical protein C884_01063 [Kocuria palustris PEL]|uniref:Uncharacterized protein n=1 Tax=Kocuria palustris PEL TaxID=1236550 RepID=M2YGP6_9MICC|nr:hypothetical protein C884_01063 [Kocuria palustris PEL]